MKYFFTVIAGFFLLFSVLTVPSYAQPYRYRYGLDRPSGVPSGATDGGTLRSCKARETATKQRISILLNLVNSMVNIFNEKTLKVETFYTSRVVPNGQSVVNYDALVANIAAKKTAVDEALIKATQDGNSYSCGNGNPKSQMYQFRLDMQAVKIALRDYRKSIVNLIVAIRSIVGQTNRQGSPAPSLTP